MAPEGVLALNLPTGRLSGRQKCAARKRERERDRERQSVRERETEREREKNGERERDRERQCVSVYVVHVPYSLDSGRHKLALASEGVLALDRGVEHERVCERQRKRARKTQCGRGRT